MEKLEEIMNWIKENKLCDKYSAKIRRDSLMGETIEVYCIYGNGCRSKEMESNNIEQIKKHIAIRERL